MKKLSGIMALVLIMSMFVGCGKKEPVTAATFKQTMEDAGYIVEDITQDPFASYYTAANDDEGYYITFIEDKTEEGANYIFNTEKEIAEKYEGNSSYKSTVSASGHRSYKLTSGGTYYHITQIGKTIIVTNVRAELKDEVQDVLKRMGY